MSRISIQSKFALKRIIILSALLLNSACATVIEGSSQKITIDTAPEGATCVLKANDNVVAVIHSTPETITVSKSKYDIVTECTKPGYVTSKIKNHSDMALVGLGNFAMLQYGFVGNLVDSATGAANKYDSHMMIPMDVNKAVQPFAADKIGSTPMAAVQQPVLSPFKSPEVYESLPGTQQAVPVTPVIASAIPVSPMQTAAVAQDENDDAPEAVAAVAPQAHLQQVAMLAPTPSPVAVVTADPILDVTQLYAQQSMPSAQQMASLHVVDAEIPAHQSALIDE